MEHGDNVATTTLLDKTYIVDTVYVVESISGEPKGRFDTKGYDAAGNIIRELSTEGDIADAMTTHCDLCKELVVDTLESEKGEGSEEEGTA